MVGEELLAIHAETLMYQVGTDIGNANKQRQGTGLATVLQGGNADDNFLKYASMRSAQREEQLAKREAQRAASLKKLTDMNPDFFYRHQQEKMEMLNNAQRLGIEAMQAGIDNPWESADPRAIAFQKAATELQNAAQVSEQIGNQYKAFQQDVQAKGANYFDPRSLSGMEQYFDRPLSEHRQNPSGVPLVTQRQPLANLTDFASALAGKINGTLNGTAYDPAAGRQAVREAFLNPDPNNNLAESATLALANYSPSERAEIEKKARDFGISAPEMLAAQMVDQFALKQKPFNVNDALAAADNAFDVTYSKYEGTDTFSKTPDKKTTMQGAMSAARSALRGDPRALNEFAAMYGLKHDPNETEVEFFDEVQRTLAADLYARKKKDRESGVFRDKADDQKLELSTDRWLRDMKSGDFAIAQNASGVLQNLDYLGNLKVKDARVQNKNIMSKEGEAPVNLLVLDLETPTQVKMTKQDVMDATGANEDDFEITSGSAGTTVTFDLSKMEPNNQLLRSMYQRSAKKQGVLYGETFQVPQTLDELIETTPAKPAKSGTNSPEKFKLKGR